MGISRIAWISVAFLVSGAAFAEFKPDASALMKDLTMLQATERRMTLVLWLPTEFWRTSLEGGGKIAQDEVERFIKEIDPYVVLAVADGQVGIAGSVNFAEPDILKNSVTIENAQGTLLSPLPEDAISSGVKNLTQMMRPMLGNMAGSLGSHMAFIVFPSTAKQGGPRTVEASKDGALIVHVGTAAVRYRLPIGSLLPPALDPQSGESFPGNYHFNPFTGNKLSPAPAGQAKPATEAPTQPSTVAPATGGTTKS